MMVSGAAYLVSLVTFVACDMLWLSQMAPRFYRPILGDMAVAGVNLPPAILFYLVYPIGLVIFAVSPALKSGSAATALLYGALFGFFTYSTYDLTNHATLRNWSTALTLVDAAWGTILAGITTVIAFSIVSKI